MSKEQLTAQEAQPDTESAGAEDRHGLRADLHAQIMRMSPADAESLADMIDLYPSFMGAIMMVAAPHLGNAAVQRAIAIVKQKRSVQGRKGSLNQDETREALREPADSRPLSGAETIASLHDASDGSLDAAPTAAPKHAAPEPAWVASARRYNAAHAGLVAEFNDLTSDMCLGDNNEIDPQAVARWQRAHDLDADGKVGPNTVATARFVKAKPAGGEQVAATDSRPPV